MSGYRSPEALDIPTYVPAEDGAAPAIGQSHLEFLEAVAGQCGDIGGYWRGGKPAVLVNTPDLARAMLIDQAHALTKGGLQQTAFHVLLGDSLSLSDGSRHQMLRRLLAPLFTRRQVSRHTSTILSTASVVCATWPREGPIDLFTQLHRLTLHTLGQVLIAEPELWNEKGDFWRNRERLWQWITGQAGQGGSLTHQATSGTAPEIAAAITAVQAAIDAVVAVRFQRGAGPADLLSDILAANKAAGNPLSGQEIRDQLLALLFAAHETSACALFWSLYLLGANPEHRQRLQRERAEAVTSSAHTPAAMAGASYTTQVLREAMRLYPPAGSQFRVTRSTVSLGGHRIPAGMPVTVCQYLLHRHPGAFPDPDAFQPSRFAPQSPARHPLAYIPFGAGERICLGRHYALLETTLLLEYLSACFDFTFPGPVRPRLAVTLRPDGDVTVHIGRRATETIRPGDGLWQAGRVDGLGPPGSTRLSA